MRTAMLSQKWTLEYVAYINKSVLYIPHASGGGQQVADG